MTSASKRSAPFGRTLIIGLGSFAHESTANGELVSMIGFRRVTTVSDDNLIAWDKGGAFK